MEIKTLGTAVQTMGGEIQILKTEMQNVVGLLNNATEVISNLKSLVMDLAEMVSAASEQPYTPQPYTEQQPIGVAVILQEAIEKEHAVWESLPTINSDEVETGNKQQAVDFSQVQEAVPNTSTTLDATPTDEFEFDFFDVAGWDTLQNTPQDTPQDTPTQNETSAIASANGDVEEFDPLASR